MAVNKTPRTCLSAGHGMGSRTPGKSDPGADVKYDNKPDSTEDDYTLAFCKSVGYDLGHLNHKTHPIYVMIRNGGVYYKADDEAAAKACDYFIEFHTNSGGGTGTEVLYEDPKDKDEAELLSKMISAAIKRPNRGAKRNTGLAVLSPKPGMVQLLCELWFGDSKADVTAHRTRRDAEVLAVVNFLLKEWGWKTVTKRPSKMSSTALRLYKPF